MPLYATYSDFVNSSFGRDYVVGGDCAVYETSGQVTEMLEYISAQIDLYTGRSFVTGIVEQDFKASPKISVYLDQFPVHQILSVSYFPTSLGFGYATSSAPVVMEPNLYTFRPDGRMLFNGRLWPESIYTVRYIAGPLTVPTSIKHATLLWANIISQSLSTNSMAIPDGGAVTSVQFDKVREIYVDPRTRYDGIDIPMTVKAILDRYKLLP